MRGKEIFCLFSDVISIQINKQLIPKCSTCVAEGNFIIVEQLVLIKYLNSLLQILRNCDLTYVSHTFSCFKTFAELVPTIRCAVHVY